MFREIGYVGSASSAIVTTLSISAIIASAFAITASTSATVSAISC